MGIDFKFFFLFVSKLFKNIEMTISNDADLLTQGWHQPGTLSHKTPISNHLTKKIPCIYYFFLKILRLFIKFIEILEVDSSILIIDSNYKYFLYETLNMYNLYTCIKIF